MADSNPRSSDFNIRPPAATPNPAASSIPSAGRTAQASPLPPGDAYGGLSSNDTVIGVAIVLALALLFFFVRGGLRSHLIAMRASPSAAGNAGWSLFAFLLALSVTVVFGLLGNLWQVLAFLIPMSALILVTLAVFAVLYNAAARGRR